jgi:hypothetical protein
MAVGRAIAAAAQAVGITTCVFDRGGYLYHGRVKASLTVPRRRTEILITRTSRKNPNGKYRYSPREGGDLELTDKVVQINRVVKTTKGGRAFFFSALVVVGDGNGVVGHGLGKAKEVQEQLLKALMTLKRTLSASQ